MIEFIIATITGSLFGVGLAFVAYLQQLPQWKEQGFAKAKTPEEKEKVREYYKHSQGKMKNYWLIFAIPAIFLMPMIAQIFHIGILVIVSIIPFIIFFLGGFILSAFLADKSVRKIKLSA